MTLAVSIAQSGANNVTMRNRIINGNMMIDQRNAGASVTPSSNTYQLDRWVCNVGGGFTVQQNAGSVTPPAGFSNYYGVTSTGSQSASNFSLRQFIEGFNSADFGFGTANAQPVTLSFWVRSSLTGTFGGAIQNSAGNRSYVYSYTINSANTWQQVTVTIPGDTGGTWIGATNGAGIVLYITYSVAAGQAGATGSWTGNDYRAPTGQTNVVGTNGATFYVTGVQLEEGTTATAFEQRLFGTELALCQRYYYKHTNDAISNPVGNACMYNATQMFGVLQFPVTMRTSPTIVQVVGTDYYRFYRNNAADLFSSFSLEGVSPTSYAFYNSTEISGTAGHAGWVELNSASGLVAFTAEL